MGNSEVQGSAREFRVSLDSTLLHACELFFHSFCSSIISIPYQMASSSNNPGGDKHDKSKHNHPLSIDAIFEGGDNDDNIEPTPQIKPTRNVVRKMLASRTS